MASSAYNIEIFDRSCNGFLYYTKVSPNLSKRYFLYIEFPLR